MKKNAIRKKIIRILSLISAISITGIFLFFIIPIKRSFLYPEFSSFKITDRNGIILREVLSQDSKTSVWKEIRDISPDMIKATIVKEDKRFFLHNGVDLIAAFRAIYENLRYGRVESGGSTITMQVAKIILNHKKRTIFNKIIECLYALKLELYLNKTQILEIYLNRIPYGNQTYGLEAASQLYFQKSSRQLSLGECCILCALPKSPGVLNPFEKSDRLISEKSKILGKLLKEKMIDSLMYDCSIKESQQIKRQNFIFRAPHFVDFVLMQKIRKNSTITSTIDYCLQEKLEKMLFTSIKSLRKYNVNQGAIIVMDTRTGEVLAMVGSKDYFEKQEGQVNGCIALRQPGSSLKPFLYILSLENGFPMSYLMNDTILEFKLPDGTIFAPRNYSNKYHRLVRAREALGSSFNVPAVYLLEKIGVENFYSFLTKLHFTSLFKNPNFYGLSLSLGAAEVKLIELVNGYRTIANKGIWTPYRIIKDEKHDIKGERVFSEEAAYIITSVLADNSSRIKAFGDDSPLNLPFPCAVKTGTTKNFKDNWCVGFTEKYTVGVWVGNFDNSPMNGVSGISGAAPLFRDIMIELHKDEYPKNFQEPKTLVHANICARSGMIAGKNCPVIEEIFIPGTEPKDTCIYCGDWLHSHIAGNISVDTVRLRQIVPDQDNTNEFHILHPQNGDIFKIDPQIPIRNQSIAIRINTGNSIKSYALYLNGKLLCEDSPNYLWQPAPGKYELRAIGKGESKLYEQRILFTVY
ncbi:MAG: penicillin-binding protein 1C [bacterium]